MKKKKEKSTLAQRRETIVRIWNTYFAEIDAPGLPRRAATLCHNEGCLDITSCPQAHPKCVGRLDFRTSALWGLYEALNRIRINLNNGSPSQFYPISPTLLNNSADDIWLSVLVLDRHNHRLSAEERALISEATLLRRDILAFLAEFYVFHKPTLKKYYKK